MAENTGCTTVYWTSDIKDSCSDSQYLCLSKEGLQCKYNNYTQPLAITPPIFYQLVVASPYVGMTRKQVGGSSQRLHGDFITRKKMLVSKSSLIMLLQSTVAIRASRNYFKVAYLKRLKSRNVHLLSFFLSFFLFLSSFSSSASLAPWCEKWHS